MHDGQVISHYKIVSQLGRGGMGIVYKAEDTKLDRTVALKLLPPHALVSEDDRARFYREARAAAALNHANIAHVYEIDEADVEGGESRPFIAMEYIDGETLSDVIARGPLPLKDAINYASQIAEGLKVAHEANVVHRDIKSGNIMLTSKGVVKILDFGLAKTAASTKLTQMGSTLGTVAYMSPEQAKGEEVDRRSDIWSTGVILYEMITGRLPFPGDYEQAIVYGILNEDPESLTTLRAGVPMALDGILAKMLAKDRDLRYQHVDELPADLKAIDLGASVQTSRISTRSITAGSTDSTAADVSVTETVPVAKSRTPVLAAALALLAGIVLGAGALYFFRGESPAAETSVKRLSLPIPEESRIATLDVTPDGSSVVYTTVEADAIRVLNLEDGSVRTLDGTEGALVLRVSPDGNWIMMTMVSGVKRVSLFGGKPISVVDATTEPGPYTAWGPNETLVYEDFSRLWTKPLVGGTPLPVSDLQEGELDHDWPYVLPDGKTMIATIEYTGGATGIGMWDLPSRQRIGVLEVGGYAPRWIQTGHLVFELDGELMAVPFDLSARKIAGVPASLESLVGARTFSVSAGGTFVSLEATVPNELGSRMSVINQANFDGSVRTLPFEAQAYFDMRVSPDGTRLALEIGDQGVSGQQDIWVLDLDDGFRERITFDNSGDEPVWSPSGDSLLYVERVPVPDAQGNRVRLLVRSADGTGGPRTLYADSLRIEFPDWSRDGTKVVFARTDAQSMGTARAGTMGIQARLSYNTAVVVLDVETGTLAKVEESASRARFSPDGRYIAYEHRDHIFVKPTSLDGGVWDVSDGPGREPHWSGDGSYLYFLNRRDLMRIEVAPSGGRIRFGNPEVALQLGSAAASYTLTEDDEAIYYTGLPQAETEAEVTETPDRVHPPVDVVVNWFEHVKRLSPVE